MKLLIQTLIQQALQQLETQGYLKNIENLSSITVDQTKDKKFGDFASNVAMILAKSSKKNPRELAAKIIENLPSSSKIKKVELAGPGFINFYLTNTAFYDVIAEILTLQNNFGCNPITATAQKILVEYVSANPTGPLHVGHGRSAAFGSALCALLKANGIPTQSEYYVNDAGRQMDILAVSVWLRYLSLCGVHVDFPANGYQGDYVVDIANILKEKYDDTLVRAPELIIEGVPQDETLLHPVGDKEAHIDGMIANMKVLLNQDDYGTVFDTALENILRGIRQDLADFGVTFDGWFSEKSLFQEGYIYKTIDKLQASGHTYEKEGHLWFKASQFGDEKDRVLIRKNGIPTYFANDISYHLSKFDRGATLVIDVLGSDHHGYVPRVKAALQALGIDPTRLVPLFVQFAILYRGKERVQMSTRSGSFVTLHDLQVEVGKDAARYFYLMRKNEQHLDFDLELATSKSNENPVYYIQYAYARIASVLRQLEEKNLGIDKELGLKNIQLLTAPQEKILIHLLAQYKDVIQSAGLSYEPHQLCHYLRELAGAFHTYYNALAFIVDDELLRHARIVLILAIQQILYNGLSLLDISLPERM